MKKISLIILFFYSMVTAFSVLADDKVTLELKMKDGDMIPLVLNAPANKIIRIKVSNIGKGPSYFCRLARMFRGTAGNRYYLRMDQTQSEQ